MEPAKRIRYNTGARWCSVAGCRNNSNDNKDLSFFQFPRDPERSRKWIELCGRDDLKSRSLNKVNKNCKVCAVHFGPKAFSNFQKNRLFEHAVPSLKLNPLFTNPSSKEKTSEECGTNASEEFRKNSSTEFEKSVSEDFRKNSSTEFEKNTSEEFEISSFEESGVSFLNFPDSKSSEATSSILILEPPLRIYCRGYRLVPQSALKTEQGFKISVQRKSKCQ